MGGGYGSQLTSFFIAEKDDKYNFISMDAGTSYDCIATGNANGQLKKILNPAYNNDKKKLNKVGYFRQQQLNGFLVTHAHNDHLTGLVISSANERTDLKNYAVVTKKPIIATPEVMEGVKQALKGPLWPDMIGLGFYDAKEVDPDKGEHAMATLGKDFAGGHFKKNKMKIQTYPLSHDHSLSWSPSTAFKVCNSAKDKSCILFFGDTAPDDAEWRNLKKRLVKEANWKGMVSADAADYLTKEVQTAKKLKEVMAFKGEAVSSYLAQNDKTGKSSDIAKGVTELEKKFDRKDSTKDWGLKFHPLQDLWDKVAPEIANGIIHTIFIECSYDDSRPEYKWFGHLIPRTLIKELVKLDAHKDLQKSEKVKLSVVVMHIKPSFDEGHTDHTSYDTIGKQLDLHQKWNLELDNWEKLEKQYEEGKENGKWTPREWTHLEIQFLFPQQTDIIHIKKGKHAVLDEPTGKRYVHSNAHRGKNNLLVSDFGGGDDEVDYGNVNGHFMHYREPQYGQKSHGSYHHAAGYEGGGGGGYYLAPAVPSSHYQNHLDVNLILFTTILMFLCICMCCASFLCGFSVRHVIRKLIKTKRYRPVYQDEIDHDHIV